MNGKCRVSSKIKKIFTKFHQDLFFGIYYVLMYTIVYDCVSYILFYFQLIKVIYLFQLMLKSEQKKTEFIK